MKKHTLRTATMILGSILALSLVFTQYVTEFNSAAHEKVKTEQADNNGDREQSFISLPTFSVPVPVSVQANLNAYCLFEILLSKDDNKEFVKDDVSYTGRFFQTMLRVIISPNAP